MNEDEQHYETCRISVGSAGPASLSLPSSHMAYCYIGPFSQESPLIEPIVWTTAPDGVKESDAIGFLNSHHIPFRIDYCYISTRKAEKYIDFYANCRLCKKGIVRFIRYSDNNIHMDYYLSPGLILNSLDLTQSIKKVSISGYYNRGNVDDLLSMLINLEPSVVINTDEFRQRIPKDLRTEYKFYYAFSSNREEDFACHDNYDPTNNALILSDFFYDAPKIYLAWSVTPSLRVPCYISIRGAKHISVVPWEADIENTFLVYLDENSELYFFERIAFNRLSDGNFDFCITDALEKHGINLKTKGKGECRKILSKVGDIYQNISAGPNGFCLGATRQISPYFPLLYYAEQYLKDCEICGHKIIRITPGHLDEGEEKRKYWLPTQIGQLFRWNGKITEKKLLQEGKSFLIGPTLYYETEKWVLQMYCEESLCNLNLTCFRVLHEGQVLAEVDITGLSWQEAAKALIELLRSFRNKE